MLNYDSHKFKHQGNIITNSFLSFTTIVGGKKLILNIFLLIFMIIISSISNVFAVDNIKQNLDKINKICAEAEIRYQDLFTNISTYSSDNNQKNTVVIKLYKYTFCPPYLEITKGTTIQFVNVDKRTSHSVWFKDNGRDESDRFFPEETVEMFFNDIGEFNYLCGPHWQSDNMFGVLKIIK